MTYSVLCQEHVVWHLAITTEQKYQKEKYWLGDGWVCEKCFNEKLKLELKEEKIETAWNRVIMEIDDPLEILHLVYHGSDIIDL